MADSGLALGIDLGGSKIYAVVTDSEHRVLGSAKLATDPAASPEKTVADMHLVSNAVLKELNLRWSQIQFCGAAAPSPVDPKTGDCLFATNLSWKRASMKQLLEKEFKHTFALGNDGNLGQLAEHVCGAAKGFRSSIGYFVGTGLGGGIILQDRLLVGNMGMAGEFGHVTVSAGGRRCGCGRRGCAEAYCSKKAFVRALHKEIFVRGGKSSLPSDKFTKDSENIKSKYLAKAYQAGDPIVCKVVNKGFRMLGVSAASMALVFGTECLVLGGGVIESMGSAVLPVFMESFKRHLFGLPPDKIQVRLSALGDHAVAVGAAVYARGGIELL